MAKSMLLDVLSPAGELLGCVGAEIARIQGWKVTDGVVVMPQSTGQSDLCPAAVKAARRLQALPKGRFYIIMLFKRGGEWVLSIPDDSGYKAETIKADSMR